jgi:hypothetical protein
VGRAPTVEAAPDLYPDMVFYWEFFQTLHLSRQVGPHGPQPLAVSDIYALTQLMRVEKSDDLEFIVRVIPHLDQIYLTKVYAEQQKIREKQAKKPQPRKRG